MEQLLIDIIERNRHHIYNGRVADYIPALRLANINDIGLSYIDATGNIFKIGEFNNKFTMQSISKIISLILAIRENGVDEVFERVGCQGTDEAYNSFIKLDFQKTIKPANPMINSGAILTTSMISGTSKEKINKILKLTRVMANNPNIGINEDVYKSELNTGARNRAIAYLMKDKGILEGDIEAILDTYFKQCAIEVDTVDLANIGRCISNEFSGISFSSISNKEITILIKAIASTCGMYNYSTRFAIDVGIPSKSGVSGGILGILENGSGIGIYSPGLDDNGNSVVGLEIMKDLSSQLDLNIFYNKRTL